MVRYDVRYDSLFYLREYMGISYEYNIDTTARLKAAIDIFKPVVVVLKIVEPYNKFYAVLETGRLVRVVSELLPVEEIFDIMLYLTMKRYVRIYRAYIRVAGVPVEEIVYLTTEDMLVDVIKSILETIKLTYVIQNERTKTNNRLNETTTKGNRISNNNNGKTIENNRKGDSK